MHALTPVRNPLASIFHRWGGVWPQRRGDCVRLILALGCDRPPGCRSWVGVAFHFAIGCCSLVGAGACRSGWREVREPGPPGGGEVSEWCGVFEVELDAPAGAGDRGGDREDAVS